MQQGMPVQENLSNNLQNRLQVSCVLEIKLQEIHLLFEIKVPVESGCPFFSDFIFHDLKVKSLIDNSNPLTKYGNKTCHVNISLNILQNNFISLTFP